MSSPVPPTLSLADSRLWDAIQAHARECRRTRAYCVLVMYDDGSGVELRPDGRVEEVAGDTEGEFPPERGWGFRAGQVSYNGRAFRLGGLRWKLLRALAAAAGSPVRDRVLKLKVWGDPRVEDARLKDVAFQLRNFLRAVLALEEEADPVERVEGGYSLTLN